MKTTTKIMILLMTAGWLLTAGCAATQYRNEKARSDAEAHRRLGDAYREQGNFTRALRSYVRALEIYEPDPDTHYSMGIVYKEKENYEKAIYHYKRAIELRPDMGPAKNGLGVVYNRTQQYDKAIEVFTKLIEDQGFDLYLTPHYPKFNLGLAYYHKGDYENARKYFREVNEYFASGIPKDRIYVLNQRAMGMTYLDTENPMEALKYFDRVTAVAPRWPDIYLDIARANRMAGFEDLAVANYRKVMAMAPDSAIAETAAREMGALSQ